MLLARRSLFGHAIRPSTYADDAEVASRLEPTSKCMVMCFLVRLANPIKIASFSVNGVSLAFFFQHIQLVLNDFQLVLYCYRLAKASRISRFKNRSRSLLVPSLPLPSRTSAPPQTLYVHAPGGHRRAISLIFSAD